MLILYDSAATSFSNLGLGVLKDFCSNAIITEVLNAEYNLEFEYANNGWLSENLLKGNIIKANGQLFRIWDVRQDLTTIKILAKHIFFDLSKNFLEDVAPTNLSGTNALNWILERTQYPHQFIINGDCSNVASARYVRKNPIDAIYNEENSILKKFGGEIELDNFNVFLHQKRGKNSGFSIRYGKNLSGVKVEMDFSGIATRIMPQGKDELLIDEKYIDSPLINNYFAPFYKKVDFNDIGIDEENGIDEEQAKNKLKEATLELFEEGIDKPTIAIKIDFIELSKTIEYKKYMNLETVSIGDTIKAFIPSLHLNLETRVVKIEFDCALKRIVKLELGSITPNIVTSQSQSNKDINNQLEQINPDSILNQAKDAATNIINHPFSGNLYISEDTGELLLMDTTDPNTATNVWKWGLGGLGFSSNGINGPYEVAMTQDGSIVADFISTGILSASRIEGYAQLLQTVSEMGVTVDKNYTELNQTIDEFKYSVQNAGGSNLIKNSVMFAYDENNNPISWETELDGNLLINSSAEALTSGSLSGHVFTLNNKIVRQKIEVKISSDDQEPTYYTFSTKIKKDVTGNCYVKIYNSNEEYLIELLEGQDSFYSDYEIKGLLPKDTYYIIEFYGSDNSNATFTDNMFSVGEYRSQWSQANGEIMNTQVNINENGVLVKSSIYQGDYTVMSPLEFAGYSKINGVITKVFSLNKDTTLVKKMESEDEIKMIPIKIVPITSGELQGWAFVPSTGGAN